MVRLGCQWETISDLMVAAFTWSSRLCSVSPANRHKHDKTIDNFLMSTPSLSRVGFTSTMYQSELQIQTIFQESENCAWRRPGILTWIRIFRGSTYYLFIRDAPDNLAFLIYGIRPDTGNGCRIPETAAGYPAKYATQELYINTAYNIPRSFDFRWPKATLCDLMWPFMIPCDLMWPQQSSYDPPWNLANLIWPHVISCDLSQPHVTVAILMGPQQPFCDISRPLLILADFIWPQLNSLM